MVRPKQISDEEILEEALACFMESGVGVSVQVIADRVGLSQPALFKRFGTKEELILRALAPPEKIPVIDWIETLPEPGPIRPQLEALFEKLWETFKWLFPRIALIRASQIAPETVFARYEKPPPLRLLIAIGQFLERAQKSGQIRADVVPEACAQSMLGVMQGRAFFQFMMRAEYSPDDALYIQSAADLLCRGMSPTEDES